MSDKPRNWHDRVFFGLHYDLHAGAKDTELGRELTAEHLRERLLRVKPDWIQCDCKGHAGYTSWPTEVGSTSPGVVRDALRIHRDVTRELGIKLGMHYSGVWDSRAVELHPEWARVNADGQPDKNMTCRLSGYDTELMIPQMLELVEKYDVDGFWVDGENWASAPCWCDRCQAEFTSRTGLTAIPRSEADPHWASWLAFHRDLFVEHVTGYANAVHAAKPDCLICSNWMYTVRQPEAITAPLDYLSGDYDWIWGADRAAVEGRVLDGRELSWDLMAWGFIKTGDMSGEPPWVLKPLEHLCQELAEVVALGGAVMIYNQPQRTGWLTGWHQDRFAAAAAFCRERQEACFQSVTVPQAAVLHLAEHYYSHNDPLYNYGSAVQPLEGALHALLETHHSTDILLEHALPERLRLYPLVVIPEATRWSEALQAQLTAYAQAGGHLIASGDFLARDYPDLVGADPAGEPEAMAYLEADGEAVPVSGPWQPVAPRPGTEAVACRLSQQEPDKDTTDQVIITRRYIGAGSVTAIHGPVFRNYFLGHYPLLRRVLAKLFAAPDIPWRVTVDAPPQIELILREKAGRLVTNLLNRGAGEMLMPRRVVNEYLPPVRDVVVRVRCDAAPTAVTSIPADDGLEWTYADGLVTVRVPEVHIHSVILVQ